MVDELIAQLIPALAAHRGAVKRVFLRKGELRILSDRALANAFEILACGTRLEGASLQVEAIAAHVVCRTCGYAGAAGRLEDAASHFAVPVLACPVCGADVEVATGRELYVDRVTLDDEEAAPAPPER